MPCIDLVTEDDISLVTENDRILVTENSFCGSQLVRIKATAHSPAYFVRVIQNGLKVEVREAGDVFAEVIS